MQLQTELAELQIDVVSRLRDQNSELQERLVKCGQHYSQVFTRLRKERERLGPKILQLQEEMQKRKDRSSEEEQIKLKKQISELCEVYDDIIQRACDECEQYLESIERLEYENMQLSARSAGSTSPRKARPGSSLDTDKYYTQLLKSSENANAELRKEIGRLHKEMNSREQKLFDDTMARIENTSSEQIDKMKGQIAELSQEMSLLNVDNRALREKILRTENENEILSKHVKDSAMTDKELKSLQSNLDSQLDLNHHLESKVRQLELIRMEHDGMCQQVKSELEEAKASARRYDAEHKQLSTKLSESRSLQLNFDAMNAKLNARLESLSNENGCLTDQLTHIREQLQLTQNRNAQRVESSHNQEDIVKKLRDAEANHQNEMKELEAKLEATEKQRQHANMKVKALRERLKTMQDSWQKISSDTESSFTALRNQYQQQIKEYKSIVESLKSQNSSLNTRIDSLKKVSSQHSASQVSSLEQQVCFIF